MAWCFEGWPYVKTNKEERDDSQVKNVTLRATFRAICRVAAPYFSDPEQRHKAWGLAVLLVAILAAQAGLHLWVTFFLKGFVNAIQHRNEDLFWKKIQEGLWVACLIAPVATLGQYLSGAFALEWRRYICEAMLSRYVRGHAFYRLKVESPGIDNPDQRIAQDVSDFTNGTLIFLHAAIEGLLLIFSSSYALIRISPNLFVALIFFSVIITVVLLKVFGGPLMNVQRRAIAQEADLRFSLMRIREHAESIAFFRGAPFERGRSGRFFDLVMLTLYRRLKIQSLYHGTMKFATIFAMVLPYIVVAPQFFRGEITFGEISQAHMLFETIFRSMTQLGTHLDGISNLGAQAVRIQQLRDALDSMGAGGVGEEKDDLSTAEGDSSSEESEVASGVLELRELSELDELEDNSHPFSSALRLRLTEVTLLAPGNHLPLVSELSMCLHKGESMLISGESGCGKSSLLRAVAGLWARGSGLVERHAERGTFFVPQTPYLCLGSLRENATYPGSAAGSAASSDDEIRLALETVNAEHLLARYGLDSEVDFDGVLSGGEKQRINFARVLLQRQPQLVLLDESTSALDQALESKLYELLRRQVPCFVSVGHRPNLERFHTFKLLLERLSVGGGCKGRVLRLDEGLPPATTARSAHGVKPRGL